jgi:predicted MFS family arabinose efflux permease
MLPFVADAVSYAVSFVSLTFIRPAFQEERERTPLRLRAEIVEGVSWLWRNAFLRATVLLVAGSNFAFSAIFLALIVRARNLGTSSAVIGVMLGFIGVGAIAGSFAAPPIQRRIHPKVVVIGSLAIWAVAGLILAILRNPFALGGVWAFAGFFGPVFNVTLASYRYALVPDRLLARTQSASLVVAWGAIPLGQLTAGFLLQSLGAVSAIFALAGVNVALAAAATASSSIRNARRVEELLAGA